MTKTDTNTEAHGILFDDVSDIHLQCVHEHVPHTQETDIVKRSLQACSALHIVVGGRV